MTVYVPVPVKDLPYKEGWYLLCNPNQRINEATIFYFDGLSFREKQHIYTHWLKAVELPTEEETKYLSKEYSANYDSECSFRDGAQHILSLLKQNKI